ncbi:MAG: hypothetical protein A2169_13175 [Deltaproteobacteria bacterium RBG_13_47_9]|nr:MAG: hypothetical protein A2169_13175 [Deltaproteobacteria bacterium RBG_13_47_9]
MKRRKRGIYTLSLGLIAIWTFLTFTGISFAAEKFPSREIIIVIQYKAGGPIDLITRVLAEYLKKELGVPIIVENRIEGAAIKGLLDVYRAKPDGYTLLANLLPRNAQMEIVYKAPYKILELTYLPAFYKLEGFLIVNSESPYKTLKDLIEASKKKSLNAGTCGQGSRSHLEMMLLKKKVGVDLEVVPFNGCAPSMMALLGGHIDLMASEAPAMLLQGGKIRPLAIYSDQRHKKFPGVPTFKELGYDLPAEYTMYGLSGPPGMPEDICKILTDAMSRALKNPELIKKFEDMGAPPIYLSGPEFHAVVKSMYKLIEEYKDIFIEKK